MTGPAFSPDGREIAFGQSDIWILDVDAGATRTVVSDGTSAMAPSWSHDGCSVYFGSLRTGDGQIWNVEIDRGAYGR